MGLLQVQIQITTIHFHTHILCQKQNLKLVFLFSVLQIRTYFLMLKVLV